MRRATIFTALAAIICATSAVAQTDVTPSSSSRSSLAASASTPVPALIPISGLAVNAEGKPLGAAATITFQVFKDPQGGEPLWVETQAVALDPSGKFTAQLGATLPNGIPLEVFQSGDARWLEVQIAGQLPQPRSLLASVPYALKAANAETLAGLPVQDFVTQSQLAATARDLAQRMSPLITPLATTTGTGTTNYIPVWTSSSALGNSVMYQAGNEIELGNSTTAANLSVNGNLLAVSNGSFPTYTGSAYNSQGYEGPRVLFNRYEGTQPAPTAVKSNDTLGWMDFYGYDGASLQRAGLFAVFADAAPTAGIVPGRFQMNTANASGVDTPRLTLYSNDNIVMSTHGGKVGIGTTAPAATLEVNGTAKFDGNITFASTQTFPVKGTGGGTVTSVASGSGLTGGPITTTGTLSLNPNIVATTATFSSTSTPVLSATNTNYKSIGQLAGVDGMGNPVGVYGYTGPSLEGEGVYGVTQQAYGVWGNATEGGIGVYATSEGGGSGISAKSDFGSAIAADSSEGLGVYASGGFAGVAGVASNPDTAGDLGYCLCNLYLSSNANAGVFGETQTTGDYGVYSTSLVATGTAVYGENNTQSENGTTVNSYGELGVDPSGNAVGTYGYGASDGAFGSGGITGVYGTGPSYGVYGISPGYGVFSNGKTGSSSYTAAVTALPDNRVVEFYSVSSTENLFEDVGSGKLSNGSATVTLDSTFAQAVNEEAGYQVFLTPNGDCEGLYVINKTASSFEVH